MIHQIKRLELNATRLPVDLLPVHVVQRGTYHAAAGRGMDKLIVGVINANVQTILTATGFEKHQIAGHQFIARNFGPQ
ncbi:hypothetical protein D3C78_1656460 [compost metagenome]